MDSVHSDRLSCSFSLEDVASNSKGGTRRRSQQLENSGLPKTCETCGSLASQLRRSSVCSTSKLDDQEGKKSVRSPRHRCELTSSSKYSAPRPRRIWDELPGWQLEYEALTPIQKQVMEYVASVGENASAAAKDRLKRTWRGFNISEQDFSMIEVYLAKKVPLTIRIDIQGLVPYLMNDPFYRTCFETNTKGETYLEARREFEAVLFNNLYEHPSVQPKDRPKYGVLNMVCHPFSDSRVSAFGSAYLLLKDSLRARTTVATSKENLGAAIRRVGTLDHMWHIVETLSTHEITRIHAVATGRRAKATVSPDSKYSEIQIHGMIDVR
ncbi:hypothetical protein, conserved [Eimeria maxima]|uniref:Uncharacterized protein n=1 Tax=Eimeria maxima TaxID=5804 RepID=U6M9P4_EIMMA|nr:hypothetical protein, conserved [Eimeria maxima]CDJ60746.1 hypothetical protein, conserved [Eimeria maxima]